MIITISPKNSDLVSILHDFIAICDTTYLKKKIAILWWLYFDLIATFTRFNCNFLIIFIEWKIVILLQLCCNFRTILSRLSDFFRLTKNCDFFAIFIQLYWNFLVKKLQLYRRSIKLQLSYDFIATCCNLGYLGCCQAVNSSVDKLYFFHASNEMQFWRGYT